MGNEKKSKFQIRREEHETRLHDERKSLEIEKSEQESQEIITETSNETTKYSGIQFKINEAGELMIHQEIVYQPSKIEKFEKDSSSEFAEMESYKRCLLKPGRKSSLNNRKWAENDTDLFWKGLATVGQDFQLLERYFKMNGSLKTKNQIRNKFKKEDKSNSELVNECLNASLTSSLKFEDFLTNEEFL